MLLHMMRVFQCRGGQKTLLQTTILAVEILLLPPGLISTFLMLRRAAGHLHSLLSGEHWARRVRLSLSPPPLLMCIFVNSIVVLILLTSSKLHRRRKSDSFFDLFYYDAGDPAAAELSSGTLSSPPAAALTVTLDHNNNNGRKLWESTAATENLKERRRDTIEATWAAIHGGDGDHKNGSKLKKSEMWSKPPPLPLQTAEPNTIDVLPPSMAAVEAKSPLSVAAASKSPSSTVAAKKSPPSVTATKAKSLPSVVAAKAKSPPSVAAAKAVPSRKQEGLRKSMTFTDTVSAMSGRGGPTGDDGVGGLRGPDELNKRFEDFIRNFNHELRLERQDSEERFWERIKRGLN